MIGLFVSEQILLEQRNSLLIREGRVYALLKISFIDKICPFFEPI